MKKHQLTKNQHLAYRVLTGSNGLLNGLNINEVIKNGWTLNELEEFGNDVSNRSAKYLYDSNRTTYTVFRRNAQRRGLEEQILDGRRSHIDSRHIINPVFKHQ